MSDHHHIHGQCSCNSDNHNPDIEPLDPGSQALSDALKFSFMLLKLIMILVLAGFIYSGFYTIEANEVGIELLFGRVKEGGLLRTGWHWKWPSPIEEIVRIPVDVDHKIMVDRVDGIDKPAMWYYVTDEQRLKDNYYPPQNIQFIKDGYSLTASASALKGDKSETDQMVDYNLCHTNWTITWNVIEGGELKVFEKVWDGTPDWKKLTTILRTVLADSVITVSAHYDIEDIIWGSSEKFKLEVQDYMKERLSRFDYGIEVELQLVGKETPQQVKTAFDAANSAEQQAEKLKNEAKGKSEEIMNQATADAANILAQARAYADTVVQSARADADYLTEVLAKIDKAAKEAAQSGKGEYKKVYNDLMAITVDQLYQETVRVVMANVDQAYAPTTSGDKPDQWRIFINRDPSIKKTEK